MTVQAPSKAPDWAHDFAKAISDEITGSFAPFVSLTPFTLLNRPSAANFAWKLIFLSDGAANKCVAFSDGTIWRYFDGSAV